AACDLRDVGLEKCEIIDLLKVPTRLEGNLGDLDTADLRTIESACSAPPQVLTLKKKIARHANKVFVEEKKPYSYCKGSLLRDFGDEIYAILNKTYKIHQTIGGRQTYFRVVSEEKK